MGRIVRIFFGMAGILAVAAAAVALAEFPGSFTLTWFGYRLSGTALSLGIVVVGIGIIVWLPSAIWHAGQRWRLRRRADLQRQRQQRIDDAVLSGLSALSSADARDAQRRWKQLKREKAGIWVDFLGAQIASQKGQWDAAKRHCHALLDDPRTAFIARRFLADQAWTRGDHRRALEHIEAASTLRPRAAWVVRSLAQWHIRQGNWDKALALASRESPRGDHDRRWRAVLFLERARQAEENGRVRQARQDLRRALEYQGTLIPAVVHWARTLIQDGEKDKAIAFLGKSWQRVPHPDLVSLSRDISPDPMQRFSITEKICRRDLQSIEARIVRASAALEAGLAQRARRLLEPLRNMTAPPAEACLLFARLLEDGNEETWRRRALENRRIVRWSCTSCRGRTNVWVSTCPQCGSFASMEWQSWDDSRGSDSRGSDDPGSSSILDSPPLVSIPAPQGVGGE